MIPITTNYITLNNIRLRVKPGLKKEIGLRTATSSYIGGYGSDVKRIGDSGRKLEIVVFASREDIRKIENLTRIDKPLTLVSRSSSDYNGQYYIVDQPTITETSTHYFEVNLVLQEYRKPNITFKRFVNWELPKKATTSSTKTSTATSSYQGQLMKCPTLKRGSSNKNCVKALQRQLKKCGYYVTYKGRRLLIDGVFGYYTQLAVRSFQKKKKLKVNGVVDNNTKAKLGKC